MKFIQTKVIDELFLIFFINYFIIICLFNLDFFYVIYDLILINSNLNILFLINFLFFFVIPKKKRKKKKKVKTPIEQLISICKKAIFRMKMKQLMKTNLNLSSDTFNKK